VTAATVRHAGSRWAAKAPHAFDALIDTSSKKRIKIGVQSICSNFAVTPLSVRHSKYER